MSVWALRGPFKLSSCISCYTDRSRSDEILQASSPPRTWFLEQGLLSLLFSWSPGDWTWSCKWIKHENRRERAGATAYQIQPLPVLPTSHMGPRAYMAAGPLLLQFPADGLGQAAEDGQVPELLLLMWKTSMNFQLLAKSVSPGGCCSLGSESANRVSLSLVIILTFK